VPKDAPTISERRDSISPESDSSGAFGAADAAAVPVSLSVSVADYAPLHAQPFRHLDPGRAPSALDVGDLLVERGVRVTGRVIDADTRGGLAGVPVFQFMALQEGLPRNKLAYGWRVALSDEQGRFELRDRLPYTGTHPSDHGFLALGPEGELGWRRFEALAGAAEEHEVVLELTPGATLEVTVQGERGQIVFEKLRRVTDRFLDVCLDYTGAIPMDPQLRKAVSKQRAVVDAFPSSESARAFDALARRVETWPLPSGPRGHLEFFLENLVAESRAG